MEEKISSEIKDLLVVQHNCIIGHRDYMTKNETRLYLLMLAYLKDNGSLDVEIPVNVFREVFGVKSENVYTKIKEYADSLRRKGITIETENGKHFTIYSILSVAEYKVGAKKIMLTINPSLKKYLQDLAKNFTRYSFMNIVRMDHAGASAETMRLYEICRMWAYNGEHTFSLHELRDSLDLYKRDKNGKRTAEKYQKRADFELYVLKPAKEIINSCTDLSISYEFKGRGKDTEVIFTIWDRCNGVYDRMDGSHAGNCNTCVQDELDAHSAACDAPDDGDFEPDTESISECVDFDGESDDSIDENDFADAFNTTITKTTGCKFADDEIEYFVECARRHTNSTAGADDEFYNVFNFFAKIASQFVKQRESIKKPKAWLRSVLVDGLNARA